MIGLGDFVRATALMEDSKAGVGNQESAKAKAGFSDAPKADINILAPNMDSANDVFRIPSEGNGVNNAEENKSRLERIFQTRKKPSVRAKEKRIRQNRLLRKSLTPKNALMALNEVKGVNIVQSNISPNHTGGFTVSLIVNNNQYTGYGTSKISAKNNACEKALRDIIINRMRKHPRFNLKSADGFGIVEKLEHESDNQLTQPDCKQEELDNSEDDDIPMLNLASFALYKLFSEWENEGYFIPEMHPQSAMAPIEKEIKPSKKPCIRQQLPPNWELMHPTSLLCFMRPGVLCIEKGTIGEKQNAVQSVAVSVDGCDFSAMGLSKKIARRNVAAKACNALFGTNFVVEEPSNIKIENPAGKS